MFACSIVFVIKLISASVDVLPVFQFLLVEPSLKFRGKLVALDLRGEVVVDDGVRLHEKRIAQGRESATDFFAFLESIFVDDFSNGRLNPKVGTLSAPCFA
jgi:urocanate hydratase